LSEQIISIDNAIPYLLEKKFVDISSVVNEEIRIIDASRKNRNIQIIRRKDRSYLLKQPNISDLLSAETIRRESRLYSLVHGDPDFIPVRKIMPEIIHYDSERNILVLEFISNSQSFNDYNYGLTINEFPASPALKLGDMMATYHRAFNGWTDSAKTSFLPKSFPSNLVIVRPGPFLLTRISPANLELLKLIQKYPDLLEFLEYIYTDWKTQTLIHGDMKWDNVILRQPDNPDLFQMKIVDWELAGLGDPAWDIAGVFHDFISFWIFSLPITGNEKPEQLVSSAEYPLQGMKRAIRSFWKGYVTNAELTNKQSNELLLRSTRYCAARIIQKAYEAHQSSTELSNTAVYMVQTSLNIMYNVEDAVVHLFGIPFRGY
jgi:hypothetical protein